MKLFIMLCFTVVLTSCATQTFVMQNYDEKRHDFKVSGTHHFFLGGIGQGKTVIATARCGNNATPTRATAELSFTNILAQIITFGLYTPRDYEVYCSRNK